MSVAIASQAESHAVASSIAATAPTGITTGELLIAITASDSIHNGPGGWTRQRNADSNNPIVELNVWTKIATGSEPSTYTFNAGINSAWEVVIFRITGAHPTTPFHVIGTSLAGSGTSHTLPSITTTVANCLLIGVLGVNSSSARSWAPPGSMSEIFDVQENQDWLSITAASELQAVAGVSGTRTFTLSSAGESAGVLFAIEPAPSTQRNKTRIAGAFVTKPSKVKIGGVMVEKPIKVKVGGTFI